MTIYPWLIPILTIIYIEIAYITIIRYNPKERLENAKGFAIIIGIAILFSGFLYLLTQDISNPDEPFRLKEGTTESKEILKGMIIIPATLLITIYIINLFWKTNMKLGKYIKKKVKKK